MSQQEGKSKKRRDVTFTMGGTKLFGYGLVMLFLLVWVFALGVLTGRGDIHRLFQRLGLYKTDLAARLGIGPDGTPTGVMPSPLPEESQRAEQEPPKKGAPETTVAKAEATAPAPGAKAAEPTAAAPAGTPKKPGAAAASETKKSKGTAPQKTDPETNLAAKLSFLNSLDTPTKKPPKTAAKKEGAVHTASMAPVAAPPKAEAPNSPEAKKSAPAYQVRVASFRTPEEADKALADLRKKGFKVSVQQGKDKTGATYTIRTGRFATKAEAEKVTQKLKEAKINAQIQELKQ